MTKRLVGLLTAILMAAAAGPAAAAQLDSPPAQDARAEKERSKNEEKAAKKEAERAREYQEILKNVQAEIDEFAASLLDVRYADPFLQDYINELGQSLVPRETPSGVLFSFRVLDSPVPNAYALPDGRVYLTSGLLLFVQNEAQLAMILGHEIAHVTSHHYAESVKAQKREQLLGSIFGAAAGAIIGGLAGGKKGAAEGAVLGTVGGLVVAQVRMNSYSRKQEDEADSIGVMLALDRRYDARESIGFFKKLSETFGDQDRFSNALYGRHSRNKDRMAYIDQLLTGDLAGTYNQLRAAGDLTNGSGQMHMYASRMVRDVCIVLMDEYDRYAVAKEHLERIADYRASDPKTLWALGRVYKLVGRTDADKARALDYLQRAAQLDARNVYPFTHRELGLMQARLGATPAAAESLRKYVLSYVSKHYDHPPDLEEIYDYLLTFGDRNWTAPAIDPSVIRAKYVEPARQPEVRADDAVATPLLPGKGDAKQPARKPALKPDPKKADPKKPEVKRPGGGGR